ncbi:helix-turn-helix transcriptional regulator [Spirabiliibacterium falconis]|uniref:helix-turn-helix transcriptional regulator n=1 Tax=Spirabiliibacterium falconis TaxID=572023 RepID=UPI001AADC0BD|nr:helix-turn-helix transcriptional regulator [Spirabiliibacterium falconis]MBE2894559.1 helix-turn-helix transcriptional regulator [Spirabiliibacterium falconis]
METKLYRHIDPFPELLGTQRYHGFGNGLSWKSATLHCQCDKLTANLAFHASLRLVFTLNGITHLRYGNNTLQLQANQGAILANLNDDLEGNKHFYAGATQREIVVFFDATWLAAHGISSRILHQLQTALLQQTFPITASMQVYLTQLLRSENIDPIWQSAVQQNLCTTLLLEILQCVFPTPSYNSTTPLEEKRLDMLFELLHSTKADNWTMQQIAHYCCSNPTTLQIAFKTRYNTTIMHYLHQLKMQRAKQALLSGSTVSEAAQLVGYRKTECFSAQFYKAFGIRPSKLKT